MQKSTRIGTNEWMNEWFNEWVKEIAIYYVINDFNARKERKNMNKLKLFFFCHLTILWKEESDKIKKNEDKGVQKIIDKYINEVLTSLRVNTGFLLLCNNWGNFFLIDNVVDDVDDGDVERQHILLLLSVDVLFSTSKYSVFVFSFYSFFVRLVLLLQHF